MEAGTRIPKWEGIRGSRHVYARYFQQEPVYEFLHDLDQDPSQLTKLAGRPECCRRPGSDATNFATATAARFGRIRVDEVGLSAAQQHPGVPS